jgi:hypothetical protein
VATVPEFQDPVFVGSPDEHLNLIRERLGQEVQAVARERVRWR